MAGASSAINVTEIVESPPSKRCIYRVPNSLRKLNQEVYIPKVISIGPLHIDNTKFEKTEKIKNTYLNAFMGRANKSMEDLKRVVKDLEESVRQCYEETFTEISSDDFVTMILRDASFIVELFFRNWFNEWTPDDVRDLEPELAARMQLDFILLENQLPFFIFDKLFDLVSSSEPTSFRELSYEYFRNINRQNMSLDPKLKISHFVDLLRNFYVLPNHPLRNTPPNARDASPLPKTEPKMVEHMYSATQLDGVGLKFEVDLSSNSLLDLDLHLDYTKRVLKIPRFSFDNDAELSVRILNIFALEQCHYPGMAYVTDYFILLTFLIKTRKDVDLLRQQRIVVGGFDGKLATNFINNLGKSMIHSHLSSTKYHNICVELKKFYENPDLLEYIRRNFFSTLLQMAASTVTILTLIQTVCSIISVLQDH